MHFDELRRREFITLVGGAAAAWPLAGLAQQAGKVRRIGFLRVGEPPAAFIDGFGRGLREVGLVEGRDFVIEFALPSQSSAFASDLPLPAWSERFRHRERLQGSARLSDESSNAAAPPFDVALLDGDLSVAAESLECTSPARRRRRRAENAPNRLCPGPTWRNGS